MRKQTSWIRILFVLSWLPAVTLSPLLLAQSIVSTSTNPMCVEFAKIDHCGAKGGSGGGCDLRKSSCGEGNGDSNGCIDEDYYQNYVVTGYFTCVNSQNVNCTCDAVNNGGESSTTFCTVWLGCDWDPVRRRCVVDPFSFGWCLAPYYKTTKCVSSS
jgi:hypothetical protein